MTINVFWILISASTFIVFAAIAWYFGFRSLTSNLETRRARIEQGLKDANEARRERDAAAAGRQETLVEARREAQDILARAQRLAEEERERGVAETRAEIERLREQTVSEIDAERQRALADVRGQVADLALLAASKVVGESLTGERQRRLVEEFLAEVSAEAPSRSQRN